MLGIIDVGGGMRGSFTAGIYDFLNDQGIQPFDYLIGVSAGSGNMVSYLAGQRGRNLRFYLEYAFRPEYMSMHNMLRKGSYINLDYPYTILSGPGGEDPVDLDAFRASTARYEAVVTDAATGNPVYYDKALMLDGNFDPIKASCAVPGACQPYPVQGKPGFDGGVADPIPYKRALARGCDQLVLLLTRPADYLRPLGSSRGDGEGPAPLAQHIRRPDPPLRPVQPGSDGGEKDGGGRQSPGGGPQRHCGHGHPHQGQSGGGAALPYGL